MVKYYIKVGGCYRYIEGVKLLGRNHIIVKNTYSIPRDVDVVRVDEKKATYYRGERLFEGLEDCRIDILLKARAV